MTAARRVATAVSTRVKAAARRYRGEGGVCFVVFMFIGYLANEGLLREGWGCVAGDFQAPAVQRVNVSGFNVCNEEDPLTIRVHTIERTEERRARIRVQHIGWIRNAGVGGPDTGQWPGDRCALAA